jgi:hypothetical protein
MRIGTRHPRALAACLALATAIVLLPAGGAEAASAPSKRSFVVDCRFTQNRPDDPLVFPGSPGASHLHAYSGNTAADASSTPESLRTSGGTSCGVPTDKSAYWVPALYDDGRQIDPSKVRIYYLASTTDYAQVKAPPAGLGHLTKDQSHIRWRCQGHKTVSGMTATVPTCASGQHLVTIIRFPECWDGWNTDSKDHMSHLIFSQRGVCPSTHPVAIAQVRLNVHYNGSDGGNVSLAPTSNPSVPHADWMNGWDQASLERLVRRCINAGLECDKDATIRMA